jgi:hypothetical protein
MQMIRQHRPAVDGEGVRLPDPPNDIPQQIDVPDEQIVIAPLQ